MKRTASRRSLKLRRVAASTSNHHQLTTAQMAKRMGADVWNVQKLKRFLKEKRRSSKREKKCPTIVIHDLTGHFSPLAHEFRKDTVPQIYGLAPLTVNIFTPPRKWPAADHLKRDLKRRGPPPSPAVDLRERGGEGGGHRTNNRKRKRIQGGGFCECCCVHYSDLKAHCETKKHCDFVSDMSNYRELDEFCDRFREISKKRGTGIYKFVMAGHDDSAVSLKKSCSQVISSLNERKASSSRKNEIIQERKNVNKKSRLLSRLAGDPKSRYMPNEVASGRSRLSLRRRLRKNE